jgi:hypothetical protein
MFLWLMLTSLQTEKDLGSGLALLMTLDDISVIAARVHDFLLGKCPASESTANQRLTKSAYAQASLAFSLFHHSGNNQFASSDDPENDSIFLDHLHS